MKRTLCLLCLAAVAALGVSCANGPAANVPTPSAPAARETPTATPQAATATPSPQPTQEAFAPYLEVYDRLGLLQESPLILDGRQELLQQVADACLHPAEIIRVNTEVYSQTDLKYTGIRLHWNAAAHGEEARHASAELIRLPDGQWIADGSGAPIPESLALAVIEYLQQETGWHLTYLDDIHDIVEARLVIPRNSGEPVDVTIAGEKAKQLEGLLKGSVNRGTGLAFVPGPELYLKRRDGVTIPVSVAYYGAGDVIMLEPYFLYDFGPEEEQDASMALLRLFGFDEWPLDIEGNGPNAFPADYPFGLWGAKSENAKQ
ncbi:MAG: hypothetical protein PHO66_03090 [Eubacteriales bacterium]|nr:hypothetical protein [Eubacteriales bacterium]